MERIPYHLQGTAKWKSYSILLDLKNQHIVSSVRYYAFHVNGTASAVSGQLCPPQNAYKGPPNGEL